jgi:hypothetical protein
MRASASTEKSQRQALGPMARKEMRPLETARTTRYKVPNSATSIFGRQKLEKPTFQWATETETVSVPLFSGGPLKKGEFGRRNRSKAPRERRGEAADVPKGRRGATLCKFTTYSAGRYDGIPRTCSRLRGKQARANELIAEGDGYTFIAAPRSPDLRHTSKRRRHLCYCGNE